MFAGTGWWAATPAPAAGFLGMSPGESTNTHKQILHCTICLRKGNVTSFFFFFNGNPFLHPEPVGAAALLY